MIRLFCPGVVLALAAGCGGPGGGFRPIDAERAVFWDRQTTESATLLQEIAAEFNASHTGPPLKIERTGDYGEIFRKVSASIHAQTLPAMTVCYESMVAEWAPTGALAPLDPFVGALDGGLPGAERADFFPAVIETNTYPQYGGQMFSFPFAKSVLMLYFNKAVLLKAGIESPPITWDQFLAYSRKVKEATGGYAYAMDVDCSTINGMIFSMGGEVLRDGTTAYDAPEAIRVFELIRTLAEEGLAYIITAGTYDDQVAFSKDEVAFMLRASSGRANMVSVMAGRERAWGMARIPQADPLNPATVLYGPNAVIFNVPAAQQQTAWAFIRYFTSREMSVRWALGTGYLPMRKSAAQDPRMHAFWDAWEYNRAAYDCLPFARPEPNVAGWQRVRALVEEAATAVFNGAKTPRAAALELKGRADAVIAGP